VGKRANGEGSLYQRDKDKLWIGSITIMVNGETKRPTVSGKTQAIVREKLKRLKNEQDQGHIAVGKGQTVTQYLQKWLSDAVEHSVKPRTYESYALNVRRVAPHIGRIRLKDLSAEHIQGLYGALLKGGLSARSVEQTHAVLHSALKQATRWGLTPRNPTDFVSVPRPERKEMATLTVEQVRVLFESTATDRLHALWVLLATTGLRSGEALGLTWDDIDWEANRLYVRRSLQRQKGNGLVFVSPKTYRSNRPVHLFSATITELRQHRVRQKAENLAAGRPSNEGLIFTNTRGERLDPGNVLESFQRRLKNAGLPKRRVHDLRHSVATHLMAQGTNPKVVQELLGHSTIAITLQTYSHVAESLHEAAMEKMDVFFPVKQQAS
jgi:integrase